MAEIMDGELARFPSGHSAVMSSCRFAQKSLLFMVLIAQSSKAGHRFTQNTDLDAKAETKRSVPRPDWSGARRI
jgi:hypothetical protein